MLIEAIGLRKIPNGTLRLVVASAPEHGCTSVLIGEFVGPLPHIAHEVRNSEGARSSRMGIDIIRAPKASTLVRHRHGRVIPGIAPWIDSSFPWAAYCHSHSFGRRFPAQAA